mmetsp:Transcript_17736/g.56151  ORF Transcript_17736/g.56151 Transcript_17736/m.56151 type:complete len:102 (+) Transcript_17736:58-363(+)
MGGRLTACCPFAREGEGDVAFPKGMLGPVHPPTEGDGADNSLSSERKGSLISDNGSNHGSNHGSTPEHKSHRFADVARSVRFEKAVSTHLVEATYNDALGT